MCNQLIIFYYPCCTWTLDLKLRTCFLVFIYCAYSKKPKIPVMIVCMYYKGFPGITQLLYV